MIVALPCDGGSRPTTRVSDAMNAATEQHGVHPVTCGHVQTYVASVMASQYTHPVVMNG